MSFDPSMFWAVYWTAVIFFAAGFVYGGFLEINDLAEREQEHADNLGAFDLVEHLHRQRAFSLETFGPGRRTAGVLDHIRKELAEIEQHPTDVTEWIDVVLLALDGAWRAGYEPEAIAAALEAKQLRNESRSWPDWRTATPGQAIEHIKGEVAHG